MILLLLLLFFLSLFFCSFSRCFFFPFLSLFSYLSSFRALGLSLSRKKTTLGRQTIHPSSRFISHAYPLAHKCP